MTNYNIRYSEEEIQRKVEKFRKQLLEKDSQKDESEIGIEYDEFGKPAYVSHIFIFVFIHLFTLVI